MAACISSVLSGMKARRIDNQLRGRSGRQGDPGFNRILYLAFEDDLMRRFGGETAVQGNHELARSSKDDNIPLDFWHFVQDRLRSAQKRIESEEL